MQLASAISFVSSDVAAPFYTASRPGLYFAYEFVNEPAAWIITDTGVLHIPVKEDIFDAAAAALPTTRFTLASGGSVSFTSNQPFLLSFDVEPLDEAAIRANVHTMFVQHPMIPATRATLLDPDFVPATPEAISLVARLDWLALHMTDTTETTLDCTYMSAGQAILHIWSQFSLITISESVQTVLVGPMIMFVVTAVDGSTSISLPLSPGHTGEELELARFEFILSVAEPTHQCMASAIDLKTLGPLSVQVTACYGKRRIKMHEPGKSLPGGQRRVSVYEHMFDVDEYSPLPTKGVEVRADKVEFRTGFVEYMASEIFNPHAVRLSFVTSGGQDGMRVLPLADDNVDALVAGHAQSIDELLGPLCQSPTEVSADLMIALPAAPDVAPLASACKARVRSRLQWMQGTHPAVQETVSPPDQHGPPKQPRSRLQWMQRASAR